MIKNNQSLFAKFKLIHDKYAVDQTKRQDEFNEVGVKVLEVVRSYEKMLCSHSENGTYGKYSANLADKFWDEVRKHFKLIDFIGVK